MTQSSAIRLRSLLAALALACSGGAAGAADLKLPAPPVLEGYGEVVELGSGWYLRGDIGYARPNDPDLAFVDVSAGIGASYQDVKLDDQLSLGLGVGYKFTNWLRLDGTVDYRFESDLDATLGGEARTGKVNGFVALANAYLDLGSWYGFSPYIGAGIGVAQTELTDFVTPNLLLGERASEWTFAYAFMGGVAINVAEGLFIDLGYRYLNVNDAEVRINDFTDVSFKDLTSHEIRLGFRYLIDGQ